MAALIAANVKVRHLGTNPQSLPQKGSTTIYQGAIVMCDSSGYAKPGATATGCVGVGVALDNGGLAAWTNSGADGASRVSFGEGVFGPFANSGTSIAVGDEGKDCYIVDDQTVHRTDGSGTRSPAGRIHSVTSEGVFVEMSSRIAREIANEYALLSGKSRVVNASYRHLMQHELEVFEIEHMQDVLRKGRIAMARCRYFTPKGRERHVLVCVADLAVKA